jgi:hypothetical protein
MIVGAGMRENSSPFCSGLDQALERARHAEHEARGAYIKTMLARTVDTPALDRLRLHWAQACDELDLLLATREVGVHP